MRGITGRRSLQAQAKRVQYPLVLRGTRRIRRRGRARVAGYRDRHCPRGARGIGRRARSSGHSGSVVSVCRRGQLARVLWTNGQCVARYGSERSLYMLWRCCEIGGGQTHHRAGCIEIRRGAGRRASVFRVAVATGRDRRQRARHGWPRELSVARVLHGKWWARPLGGERPRGIVLVVRRVSASATRGRETLARDIDAIGHADVPELRVVLDDREACVVGRGDWRGLKVRTLRSHIETHNRQRGATCDMS